MAVPRHLQNHALWSRILKYSVKPYVTGPLTKCYFSESLFMWVLTHDKIYKLTIVSVRSAMVSRFCVRPASRRWFLEIIQAVTMQHDPFDAM